MERRFAGWKYTYTQKTEKGFKHFERGLDLEKALAYQQWSDNGIQMRREVFVSRAEDIVVYHLTAGYRKRKRLSCGIGNLPE